MRPFSNPNSETLKLTCPIDPAHYTISRASPPHSQGRALCTRFPILRTRPAPAGGSANLTALDTARFGVPPVGSKLFLQLNQIIAG